MPSGKVADFRNNPLFVNSEARSSHMSLCLFSITATSIRDSFWTSGDGVQWFEVPLSYLSRYGLNPR